MNTEDFSIATITWARDDREEEILRQSLQYLAALNVPVFITDGGSRAPFLDFLRSFPHFKLLEGEARGVWAQAKSSLAAAYDFGSPFILYTEPDKYHFFSHSLPDVLHKVQVEEASGIVLASRSAPGFASFPPFQQMTETAINNCCAEIIGKRIDYTYGPFVLNRLLVPYLQPVQEDIGWGWRPYIFGIAHRLGYRVDAHADDFSCPFDQQEDNPKERLYRIRQLNQNIQGLLLSTTVTFGGD